MKPIAVVCLCIPLTIVTQANAGFLAVEDFDSNLSGTVNDGMAGWRFTVDDDIYVESLGLFDNDSDGFNASHQVGIWDALHRDRQFASVSFDSSQLLRSRFLRVRAT